MNLKIGRSLAGLAAILAASCFIANPADAGARDCNQRGDCAKAAQKKRLVTHATFVRTKAGPRRSARTTHVRTKAGPRRSDRRRAERAQFSVVWHGWAGSFHLDGVRYAGGNPRGPAA